MGLKLTKQNSLEGAFMIDSIQQFCGNGVKRLTNIFKTYTDDLTKIAGRIYVVTDEITRLGCNMIAETAAQMPA